MGRLTGQSHERLTLSAGVDALGEAAHQVARPGWPWLAGFFYPSSAWSWGVGASLFVGLATLMEVQVADRTDLQWADLILPGLERAMTAGGFEHFPRRGSGGPGSAAVLLVLAASLVLVNLPACRLFAGLARQAPAARWSEGGTDGPGLAALWRAGRGFALAAFGLSILIVLMFALAALALGAPWALAIQALEIERRGLLFLACVPLLAFLAFYSALLQVLNQLALHSLAANRRGVGSALIHAWRLVRAAPASAARAGAIDFLLFLLLVVALQLAMPIEIVTFGLLGMLLGAYTGTVRAVFWSRAYRALGGLSADEGVPGLPPIPRSAA